MSNGMGASLRDRAGRAAHGAAARLRRPATIACAYAFIGILTFGHDAVHTTRYREQHCATADQRQLSPTDDCYGPVPEGAFMAAALWPLYWSWELQQ
jgi:hypothetical protein